jgi:hypothetical protein
VRFATIKNVSLNNSIMQGYNYVGTLVGANLLFSKIQDCEVTATTVVGTTCVGGMVGLNRTYPANNSNDPLNYTEIINSSVSNSTINGLDYIGGLTGMNNQYSKITNCSIFNTYINGKSYIGGLTGSNNNYSTITNCSVIDGTMIGTHHTIGGICGHNNYYSKTENSYVKSTTITNDCSYNGVMICGYAGGICGQQNTSSEINNCYVISSTIQGLKGYFYGGISGLNLASSKINNCFVTASTITGTTSANNIFRVGGIVGMNRDDANTQVNNCYVTSTSVNGTGIEVGGICGRNETSAVLTNCYSTATVMQGTTQKYNCVGYISSATATNCYYLNSTLSSDASEVTGYGTGLTEATMKGSGFITTLGNTIYEAAPTSTYYTYNDGYPILTAVQKNGSNYLYETMIATPKSTMINGDVITMDNTTGVPTSPIILNENTLCW